MKNKTSLIFGANGQDGFYLNKLLQHCGHNIINVSRNGGGITGDVKDYQFVETLIKKNQPEFIFHFAANSTTRHSALFENHETISTGAINILESVKLHCSSAKVFLSGSAMQFKNEELPIDEQTPFEAKSAYAVARIQSVYAARYYSSAFGIKTYVGYFFNHDSPLRSEQHVNQKIVKTALRISQGSKEKLTLGNIEVQKEFNYAGDIIEAVWSLVNQNKITEAVIGCGKAYKIKDWLTYCFEKKKLNWKEHVILDDNFIPEYKILISNPKLIMSCGWQPKVNFNQLANMMINA